VPALVVVAALAFLAPAAETALGSPPAQGQYTLHVPSSGGSSGQTSPGSPSDSSGSAALVILVGGLVAVGIGAGMVAYRRRAPSEGA
jgi:hypothetical protein